MYFQVEITCEREIELIFVFEACIRCTIVYSSSRLKWNSGAQDVQDFRIVTIVPTGSTSSWGINACRGVGSRLI